MTDRPIIFSAPMIRALLAGTKTMTRRLAWREPRDPSTSRIADSYQRPSPWQKVKAGDRLWVRENWKACETCGGSTKMVADPVDDPLYCSECKLSLGTKTRPSIYMPRWASRITLEVTATKIERLQDIGWNDAIAEGLTRGDPMPEVPNSHGTIWHDGVTDPLDGWTRDPTAAFRSLWEAIHGEGAWAVNPELICLTFTVRKTNIDQMAKDAA